MQHPPSPDHGPTDPELSTAITPVPISPPPIQEAGLRKPKGLHWFSRPGSWRLAVVAVLLWGVLLSLNRFPTSEDSSLEARIFAFSRLASSVVLALDQRGVVPDRFHAFLGIDDDSVREEIVRIYDQATAGNRLPHEALPEWVILLDRVGDLERTGDALEALVLADVSEDLRQQEGLTGVLLSYRGGGGGQLAPETEAWLDQRIQDETWELPEWLYVAEVRGDEPTRDWLAERGRNIVRRGLAADLGYLLMFAAGIAAIVVMWIRPPSGSLARRAALPDRWAPAALTGWFFYAEVLALIAALVAAFLVLVPGAETVATVLSAFVFLAVPIWVLMVRFCPGSSAMFRVMGLRPVPFPLSRMILFTLYGVGLLLGLGFLSAWILAPFASEMIEDTLTPTGLDWPGAIWSEALIAVVLAPVGEEILFRGFLYGGLSRKMHAMGAMVVSSLVFAVSHHYATSGLFFVFLYGLVFCWLYKRTGSLWPGILAHGLYNGLITWQGVAWYSFHG